MILKACDMQFILLLFALLSCSTQSLDMNMKEEWRGEEQRGEKKK